MCIRDRAPSGGKVPSLTTAGAGTVAVITTTGAEGAALAGMLKYPFLTPVSYTHLDVYKRQASASTIS